jgi:hypothetical protein
MKPRTESFTSSGSWETVACNSSFTFVFSLVLEGGLFKAGLFDIESGTEPSQIVAADAIDGLLEFPLEGLTVAGILRSFKQQVDGAVELLAGFFLVPHLVGALPLLVGFIRPHDQHVGRSGDADHSMFVQNDIRGAAVQIDVGSE